MGTWTQIHPNYLWPSRSWLHMQSTPKWGTCHYVRSRPLSHKHSHWNWGLVKFKVLPYVLMFSFVLFSYCGNQPLKEASKYFAKQGIPFPTKVPDDQETPHLKECYIVGDKESPETPIVIFFPLVNDTFREYKAPGKFTVTHDIHRGSSCLLSLFYCALSGLQIRL